MTVFNLLARLRDEGSTLLSTVSGCAFVDRRAR